MIPPFEGAIGIDLGTTYSCVSVFLHGKSQVIPNDQGNRTTPSRVAFHNGQILVGEAAMNLSAKGAKNVVYDAKRMIGRKFSEKEIQDDIKIWPFSVVCGDEDDIFISVPNGTSDEQLKLRPEQISAKVLEYLKGCAERHLGCEVRKAVITVPAYFNDAQRERTRAAGAIAGLEVLRIVNEPTAASLCYGLDSAQIADKPRNVLVFDFGGGTFDVSVISIDSGVFEVRSSAGDTHLGGQDLDANITNFFLADAKKRSRVDFSENPKVLAKMRITAERVKRILSHTTQEEISIDGILPDGEDYAVTLSRAKFEEMNASVFKKCLTIVKRALTDAKMEKQEIDEIVMVGGSSRIPVIRQMMSEFFGKQLCVSVNPDEAIALGAAIQASILSTLPEQKSEKTAGVILMDIVSLSIGVDVDMGKFDILIPRNTTIPYQATKEFSTFENNQTYVDVDVYEGERPLTKFNHFLGSFTLDGIKKAKKGVATITVTFSVDANGILTVTAEESTSKRTNSLIVENSNKLSNEDIEAMVLQAEEMRKRDKEAAEIHALVVEVEGEMSVLEDGLEDLQSKAPEGKALPEKITKRTSFLVHARGWLGSKARQAPLEEVQTKTGKLLQMVKKGHKSVQKFLKKLAKKKSRKRARSDDDDDVGGDDDGGDDSDDDEPEDDSESEGSDDE